MKWLVAVVALSGCFHASPDDGLLTCSTRLPACPDGYHCATDNTCWKIGSDPDGGGTVLDGSSDLATIPAGAIVHLRMNDSISDDVTDDDSASHGHPARCAVGSCPTVVTAGYSASPALSCSNNDFLTIDDSDAMNFGADFTVALWAKRNTSAYGELVNKSADTMWHSGGKELFFGDDSHIHYGAFGNGELTADATIDLNWHHIAVTFQPAQTPTVVIYLDGVARAPAATSSHVTPPVSADISGDLVRLGYGPPDGSSPPNHFDGSIDEFVFYGRALAASEVMQLYNAR